MRVGDVEKGGPPMTGEPNSIDQGVNGDRDWDQLEIPIEENQTRLVKVWIGTMNQDPIGKPNWVGNEMGL